MAEPHEALGAVAGPGAPGDVRAGPAGRTGGAPAAGAAPALGDCCGSGGGGVAGVRPGEGAARSGRGG
ncbi:hypothetical protein ACFS5L_14595 [Streptomyces phyllanthi]|uniref:Uncharacterized protein n=1 Tax=Streptomyces phyllanthi TaxID=1803180 RepID=A0A5N8W4T2_9ACTN|nr:hypothetical protein [Streptomyces phyllanthi]MPY42491.1 hypothetical protein [Streptomyces phyllanthi]